MDGIELLKGKIISKIEINEDYTQVIFYTDDGNFRMFHEQDCCENVYLADIAGELKDLIGTPVTFAEEATNSGYATGDSFTWTFYRIATKLGTVVLRWYGSSNGYYSEEVRFEKF